jgi:hypothetical protein
VVQTQTRSFVRSALHASSFFNQTELPPFISTNFDFPDKPMEWGARQEIIQKVQEESTAILRKNEAREAKEMALFFYNGSVADLSAFKEEYRNRMIHVRKRYDDLQALRVMQKVNNFMERISEKINSRHHRADSDESAML